MTIFLAGGISGNCFPLFRELTEIKTKKEMDIFLAGLNGRNWIILEKLKEMDIFLAGQAPWKEEGIYDDSIKLQMPKILESYFYANEVTEKFIPFLGDFLLDSGAFTFFTSNQNINWNKYLDGYISFINRNNIKKYFELDIDSLVGYQKVLDFRKELYNQTKVIPIPVWHKTRGKKDFLQMCEQFPYVALGGIVSKEITKDDYKFFPWFISEAHRKKAKIHGLGFTNLQLLNKYHFDSVDSTAWTCGNRFGAVYFFNGKTITVSRKQEGQRLSDAKKVAVHNFNEWVKFQKYAEKNL